MFPERESNDNDEVEFDFGDPELNDPNYGAETGDNDQASTPADSAPQDPPAAEPQATDDNSTPTGADGAEGQGAGTDAQQQQPAQDQRTKTDDKGNLVDDKGNIVAAAGADRRHYERAQQQSRVITQLETDLKKARDASSMVGVLNDVPSKLGLDARETELGLQFMSSFKRDPIATMRWGLQETMKMGYNLPQIVGEQQAGNLPPGSGSLDLQAVKAMLSDAVKPLVEDRNAQQQQTQAERDAQVAYDTFLAKHESADVHQGVIANMLRNDETLTPEVAYWQLHSYAHQNGLDFNKPLREQMQSRQQGAPASNGNAQPRPAQSSQSQVPPMPNGSAPVGMQDEPDIVNPDMSWDEILRDSMVKAGYRG